jgi:lipid-binding SYLF domain-containing protein
MAAVAALLFTPAAFAANNRSDAQKIVDDSASVVPQLKKDAHFLDLMKQAKGVFILPDSGKGAFIVGGGGGQGVLIGRHNGRWSDPAFLSLGSISIGAQAGGEGGPLVMLLMTDKALQDFTDANNFSLNANAGLTIVNYSAKGQGSAGKGDVIVWSNRGGAYAGASVSATDITSNTDEDHAYYGQQASTEKIISGQFHNPAAAKLTDELPA